MRTDPIKQVFVTQEWTFVLLSVYEDPACLPIMIKTVYDIWIVRIDFPWSSYKVQRAKHNCVKCFLCFLGNRAL